MSIDVSLERMTIRRGSSSLEDMARFTHQEYHGCFHREFVIERERDQGWGDELRGCCNIQDYFFYL